MSAKYRVSKQYNPLNDKKQWMLTCCKCGQKAWARDWNIAMLLASYPCEPCALLRMLGIPLYKKANISGANHA